MSRIGHSFNTSRSQRFNRFFQGVPAMQRGQWGRSTYKAMIDTRFSNKDIVRVKQMVGKQEVMKLINLNLTCEHLHGHADYWNSRQIAHGIVTQQAYYTLVSLIECLLQDMRHSPESFPLNLQLKRRADRPDPAPFRREDWEDPNTHWVLFLNDSYFGGRVYFPTRQIFFKPKPGTVIRWPTGIPVGWEAVHAGYQLTLEGDSKEGHDKETWKERFHENWVDQAMGKLDEEQPYSLIELP